MGNQQSDLGEQDAWKVIGHVPVVNFFYGGIRAAIYASRNNMEEAHSGALAMIPFAHNIIHGVVPAATRKAIEQAEHFLKQSTFSSRRRWKCDTHIGYWPEPGTFSRPQTVYGRVGISLGLSSTWVAVYLDDCVLYGKVASSNKWIVDRKKDVLIGDNLLR